MSRRRLALSAKRAVDIVGALVGMLVLSPLLICTAIAIVVTSGRPVLFRQVRPGLHGRPFTIVKFRTMRAPHAGEVWYRSDADRTTRLGQKLRRSSIDELPELWNVLRGDMSLVGPRPLLMEYVARYTTDERRRQDMRPGITGWAAVNGRHTLAFADRLALDVWYVDHWSLRLDFRVIGLTISQVLRHQDTLTNQDVVAIDFPDRFQAGLDEGLEADATVQADAGPQRRR